MVARTRDCRRRIDSGALLTRRGAAIGAVALALALTPMAGCHDRPEPPDGVLEGPSPAASALEGPDSKDGALEGPGSKLGALAASSSAAAPSASGPGCESRSVSGASAIPSASRYCPSQPDCESVAVYAAGAAAGRLCVEDLAAHGLTLVDLSDSWTPRIFALDPNGGHGPDYRARYLELARRPSADLGLYGIVPSLSVLGAKLRSEQRQRCHAGVDRSPLIRLRARFATAHDDRARRALSKDAEARPALRAAAAELACAGLLRAGAASGSLGASMQAALDIFRRQHMIVGSGLDSDTVEALAMGGDELAFRALVRAARERVADAAGLIEDGSALGRRELVVDRLLDLSHFASDANEPLEGGAPDLVGRATDRLARALGWTSPAATRRFFDERGDEELRTLRVAVALPPPPVYRSASMSLRVEIDRGDVFYETPGLAARARTRLESVRRPSFVLYAEHDGRERPLVRWTTTIGGWQKERTDEGDIALKYKESDVGERFWRQLIAAPAWLPPDSTPETDLLREIADGSLSLKEDLVQPGYRNAYGLVMLIHEQAVTRADRPAWADHGIRTHGSVNYRSIARGESHGCHRLYNQLALRLGGYLLQHRPHKRRGTLHVGYSRELAWNEQIVRLDVPTRGYLYELDPPVPVTVLTGTVAGERQTPLVRLLPLRSNEPKAG